MAKELEYKFEIGDAQRLRQILDSETVAGLVTSGWRELEMKTTYFDTPDGRLSAKKWTLRHRLEAGRGVACLKTPTDDPNARNEYEVEAERLDGAALAALMAAGAPEQLRKLAEPGTIAPLCGAGFTRRVAGITLPDGTTANLSGDVGMLFGGGKSEPLCELEVELAEGSEKAVKAFCHLLAREFDLHLQPKSKFARAKALARN